MSMHSVSCWCGLDKARAPLAGIDPSMALSSSLAALQTTSIPLDHAGGLTPALAPGQAARFMPVNVNEPVASESCGATSVQTHSPRPLTTPMPCSDRVRTFAGRGAHFREKCISCSGKPQRLFTLKTMLELALTVRTCRSHGGAHIRGKGCALSREVHPFWWQGINFFVLKTALKPALTVRVGRPLLGAHFREKGCAYSREVVRTFARRGAHIRGK